MTLTQGPGLHVALSALDAGHFEAKQRALPELFLWLSCILFFFLYSTKVFTLAWTCEVAHKGLGQLGHAHLGPTLC